MTRRLRGAQETALRLVGVFVAALAVWCAATQPAPAVAAPAAAVAVATYTYDGVFHADAPPRTATERGPPATHPNAITHTAANNGYVDVLSPGSRKHILDGDASGGGHRWPGAPGKSPYPKSWSDDQIIHNVGDIATDPGTVWRVQTGNGGIYTSSGRPAIWRAWEVRDGTRIRVAYEPATGRVVTAFPDTGPAKGAIVP